MNLTPIFQQKYKQGFSGPGEGEYKGECMVFCEALVDFGPVGDTVVSKKHYVESNGIIAPNISEIGKGFRIGDVVITTEGSKGHGFIVADMTRDNLYVAESNHKLDGKVDYTRVVAKNDPKIYGIIRAPLKVDLGVCELNCAVFINNQSGWNLKIFDEIANSIKQITAGKLKVNFFPILTNFQNWWYEVFPFNGENYEVIAKAYLNEKMAISFTNLNKPADVAAFIINPNQWQGSVTGGIELAWTNCGRPGQIQASCAEFDVSPWYFGTRLINHILMHELSHQLHWVNGMNDHTDALDTPVSKKLDQAYSDLDFNRIKANL